MVSGHSPVWSPRPVPRERRRAKRTPSEAELSRRRGHGVAGGLYAKPLPGYIYKGWDSPGRRVPPQWTHHRGQTPAGRRAKASGRRAGRVGALQEGGGPAGRHGRLGDKRARGDPPTGLTIGRRDHRLEATTGEQGHRNQRPSHRRSTVQTPTHASLPTRHTQAAAGGDGLHPLQP